MTAAAWTGAGAGGLGWPGLLALGRAAGCGLVCSEVGLGILMVPGEVVVSPFSLGLLSGVVTGSGWVACGFCWNKTAFPFGRFRGGCFRGTGTKMFGFGVAPLGQE